MVDLMPELKVTPPFFVTVYVWVDVRCSSSPDDDERGDEDPLLPADGDEEGEDDTERGDEDPLLPGDGDDDDSRGGEGGKPPRGGTRPGGGIPANPCPGGGMDAVFGR
jgi:hypothetical protein